MPKLAGSPAPPDRLSSVAGRGGLRRSLLLVFAGAGMMDAGICKIPKRQRITGLLSYTLAECYRAAALADLWIIA
ncbi:hypothetical protein FHT00_001953 [Sphingomonas insulae]|uniref:Uncharacterized protein n=1 Tax=Sphingomonas insulae TaxID=424800 RepID=A0ABP3SZS2_9SPHN|nr:hypothetical protein [Sphingomonas insulae]NIJ30006.1 hypothetical protein [Sphingomonas insulae]